MSRRKHVLKFIGCKEFRTKSKFTEKVFEPALQVLIDEGYIISGMYTIEGELSDDYFITRQRTRKFADDLLLNPQDDVIICAWQDYALPESERLIKAGVPVVYLMLYSDKSRFASGEEPDNVIWLSNEFEISACRFVAQIIGLINNLKT